MLEGLKNAKFLPLPLDRKTFSKGSPVFDQQNMAFFKPSGNWPRAQHPGPNPGDRFQAISKDIWCPLGRCRCHQRRNGPGGSTRKASSPKPPQCPQHSTTQFWNLPPRKCLGGAQQHCELTTQLNPGPRHPRPTRTEIQPMFTTPHDSQQSM